MEEEFKRRKNIHKEAKERRNIISNNYVKLHPEIFKFSVSYSFFVKKCKIVDW